MLGKQHGILTCTKYLGANKIEITCECGAVFWGDNRTMKGVRDHCGCGNLGIRAGDKFGQWTVVDRKGYGSVADRQKVIIECVCGDRNEETMHRLYTGRTPFCRCLRGEQHHGERYGRLLIVGHDPKKRNSDNSIIYKCVCDCGNKYDGRLVDLVRGNTKSCGCIQREGASKRLKKVWATYYEKKAEEK